MSKTPVVTIILASIFVLVLGTAATAEQSGAPATPPAQSTTTPVNLNTATAADLEKLPGIGPAVAARIIEYRQKSGGFKKIEELMNVRGIGEKVFLRLKPLVTITPPKTTER